MSKITLTVSLKQFSTQQLITELWERVYDNLNDEEPQHDPALETLPHYEKDSLRQALEESMEHPIHKPSPVYEKGYPSYEAVNDV